MNWVQRHLLCWSFHTRPTSSIVFLPSSPSATKLNRHFSGHPDASKLRRKYEAVVADSSLVRLVSCRIREGFTLSRVSLTREHLEVKCSITWKPNCALHYVIQSIWPEQAASGVK